MKTKNELLSNIIVGTAQLGTQYGISNKRKNFNLKEQLNFLNFMHNNGFDNYDTAYAYKNAHKTLGIWIKNNKIQPNIYTKLPNLRNFSSQEISDTFTKSLNKLNLKNIEGLLLHNPKDILNPNIETFIKNLYNKKIIKSFGISIYDDKDIYFYDKIKIIQAPGNIFNQKIFYSDKINELVLKNVEIHIRSIFVQGLLLMETKNIPKKFHDLLKPINYLQNIAQEIKIDISILCIQCIKKLMPNAKLVIGFDNISQVSQLIRNSKKIADNSDIKEIIKFGKDNHHKLWDPRNWK